MSHFFLVLALTVGFGLFAVTPMSASQSPSLSGNDRKKKDGKGKKGEEDEEDFRKALPAPSSTWA